MDALAEATVVVVVDEAGVEVVVEEVVLLEVLDVEVDDVLLDDVLLDDVLDVEEVLEDDVDEVDEVLLDDVLELVELDGVVVSVERELSAASALAAPECAEVVERAPPPWLDFAGAVGFSVVVVGSSSFGSSLVSAPVSDGGRRWADMAGRIVRAGSGRTWAPARPLITTTVAATPASTRALRRATSWAVAAVRTRRASAAASAMCVSRTSGRGGVLST